MKEAFFKNKPYYYILIIILVFFVCMNIIQLLDGNWLMLVTIGIQTILLILILKKSSYSKIGIKIWLIILLVTGGLQLFLGIFYLFAGETNLFSLFKRAFFIVLEIILLVNTKSIEIVEKKLS